MNSLNRTSLSASGLKTSGDTPGWHSRDNSCLVMEPENGSTYPRRNDLLWKGILEDLFEDFLRFFFPDAVSLFDLERGFEYLDKELAQLYPPEEDAFSPRRVDKLVRVPARQGKEAWILLHCEVQGYRQASFSKRMFTYYSRVWDKYQSPVMAVAILTDGEKSFHPDHYEQSAEGTDLYYGFNSYKVRAQPAAELEQSDNPFAMVILTVQAALKARVGLGDEAVYRMKLDLARRLVEKGLPAKKERALMNFLRYYLRFEQEAMNVKFEQSINKLTERITTMGIEELLLAQARHEGEVKGEKKGEARGEAKGEARGIKSKELSFVQALIRNTDFDDRKIASLAAVSLDFVKGVRKGLRIWEAEV